MNKLTFSLLIVGLFAVAALARTSPQIRRPFKFTPGQTYVYEYRGRQWNGVNVADQYSGLTLECDIILQALPEQSGKEVLMKLTDIKVEQLHTQTLANNDVRKLNEGQEQNVRQIAMYKEELAKPIRFTYVDGKIVRFVAETSEAEWSINIKKSILSLFQLDLAPTKIIKSPVKSVKEQYQGYNSEDVILATQEMPLVYPIYEESFGGICETLYQIDSLDNIENRQQNQLDRNVELYNDVLNVTKTVNYKNCLTDPSVSYDRHSFNVNTQTIKGKLFGRQQWTQQSADSQQFYPIPEELKEKYSNAYTTQDHNDNVASPVPVERYSYTKYNMTTGSRRPITAAVAVAGLSSDMSIIEGIFSEGKIKYQAEGDVIMSETQQRVKLISVAPTAEMARVAPEIASLAISSVRQPNMEYHTIQCELNQQKIKFYQALWKYAQLKQQQQSMLAGVNSPVSSGSANLYSHQMALPFALSASWYPIVATGQQSSEQSLEHLVDPEQLSKSYEHLLVSLADDVLAEDVAQSKQAGEKIIRLVNVVAFMPKYKLVEIYDRIVEEIQQTKQQQAESRGKQVVVDNEETAKWKVARKLFLDSLPLAGSKQAIEMIELLIQSNRVKSWEAKEMCESVPANLRYPDTEIIDAFIRISQLPQVRQSRALFASCSIAVGKMIGQAYSKSQDASYKPTTYEQWTKLPVNLRSDDDLVKQVVQEADPRRQLPINWNTADQQQLYERLVLDEQDLAKYIQIYKQLLQKSTQYHEKVVYLETLAHMKTDKVLPILEPFVTGRLSLSQCLGQDQTAKSWTSSGLVDIERTPLEQSQYYNYNQRRSVRANQQAAAAVANAIYRENNKQRFGAAAGEQKDWSEEDSFGAQECNYMRTIAIYALAHVARQSPAKVQTMLLPVFDNKYEPYQLRIAAFTTMMLTPIDEHVLERIASEMWREPSKEVASFVVGCIDTMSRMTAPAMQPYKWVAMKAAESMPKQYLDTWRFSWMAGGDHFDQLKQTGYTWAAELIKSNVSSIPRAAYAHFGRFHGAAGQKYDNQFQFGFTSKGIESLLKQYVAYNHQLEQEQGTTAESNLIASIFENLYDSKDDIVKYYREARDLLKSSILSNNVKPTHSSEDFFFKRQQPIDGVNTEQGKQDRKSSQLFDSSYSRPKRSVTFQARASADEHEEPKLTLFSKIFDQTAYHSLDKQQIISLLEKCDDYLKMVAEELVMGGKLHYVKMMMPSNMWHMVPSQMGLPIIVTHRSPLVFSIKIDGSANGQLTSSKISQYYRQQATGSRIPNVIGQNFVFPTGTGLNITALVHPKIMHSNYRFMFAVEQANCEAYGVQVEKSHQWSLPMEVSVAYSAPKELVSLAIEPKTPARMIWTKEAAKTFIGQISVAQNQADKWLGQEHLVRVPSQQDQYKRQHRAASYTPSVLSGVQSLINSPKEQQMKAIDELETPYKFERRHVQQLLGLEVFVEGVSDDEDVVRAITKESQLNKESRGQLEWSHTQPEMDDLDQHTKSGPFGDYLHLLDSTFNRPSKYLEFFATLKPDEPRKSPVYRFDFVLNNANANKQNVQQLNKLRSPLMSLLAQ